MESVSLTLHKLLGVTPSFLPQISDISARIAALKSAGLDVDTQSRVNRTRTVPVMVPTLSNISAHFCQKTCLSFVCLTFHVCFLAAGHTGCIEAAEEAAACTTKGQKHTPHGAVSPVSSVIKLKGPAVYLFYINTRVSIDLIAEDPNQMLCYLKYRWLQQNDAKLNVTDLINI